jgi:hypothetical protein
MNTYRFTQVNQWGNSEVIETKSFATNEEAKARGEELLNIVRNAPKSNRADAELPYIIVDKLADNGKEEDE